MKQKVRVSKDVYEIGKELNEDIFLMELMKEAHTLKSVDIFSIIGLMKHYARARCDGTSSGRHDEVKTKHYARTREV